MIRRVWCGVALVSIRVAVTLATRTFTSRQPGLLHLLQSILHLLQSISQLSTVISIKNIESYSDFIYRDGAIVVPSAVLLHC